MARVNLQLMCPDLFGQYNFGAFSFFISLFFGLVQAIIWS